MIHKILSTLSALLMLPFAWAPLVIHWQWSGPALWSQSSSSAFDLWLFLWGFVVVIGMWTTIHIFVSISEVWKGER